MCFFGSSKLPAVPATPSASSDAARTRIAQEMMMNDQASGRKATILTTPLGDSNFGKNVR